MKSFIKKYWKLLLALIIGNFIYSLGVIAFIKSNGLITGGVTGISLFLHYLFEKIPVSVFSLVLNLMFFFFGWLVLGKKFALSTLASTIISPACIGILELFDFSFLMLDDLWLSIICGGVLIGLGLGIIMREGASTGGVDIIAILINRRFKFITIGVAISVIDILILLVQLTMKPIEFIIYGIVLAGVYSFVIDKVIMAGNDRVELKIISKKKDEIKQIILNEFDRGVTLIHTKTGYLEEECDMILSVISYRELMRFRERINEIDPIAFMIISKVSEVNGHGFSLAKKYLSKQDEMK